MTDTTGVGVDPDKSELAGRSAAASAAPQLSLPKAGGAIRGMGEKFNAHPVTGTGSMTVPIFASPGRSGFGPQLSLSYDSGAGNGAFGFGWSPSLASITRKTQMGLPLYDDAEESDVFVLSGSEDLVPVYRQDLSGNVVDEEDLDGYRVRRYRPRIEGLFALIERWTRLSDGQDVHWRTITKDNVLTLYGLESHSRIADPVDASRIFSWLICETRDDRGNGILYRYKPEDGAGVDLSLASERNRGPRDDPRRTANRYIKRIHYGNRASLLDAAGQRPRFLDPRSVESQLASGNWMFEVVFDYGEHSSDPPAPRESGDWTYRPDPLSSYRAGFEVRTTRLCRRVLMFHHFEEETDVGRDCLVRSTDLAFSQVEAVAPAAYPVYSFVQGISQTGYLRTAGAYDKESLPPVQFEYTRAAVENTVYELDPQNLEDLPAGVDDSVYRWTDLHGEGVAGLLTQQADTWFYKRNLTPISTTGLELALLECVAARPSLATLEGGAAEFMDLAGDGVPDVVLFDGPTPGFYAHDEAESWQSFQPFASQLNRDFQDPNLRFIDLNGDGLSDILITEDSALVWHPSLGKLGYGPQRRLTQARDEETGPRLLFADGTGSVYLADMSGDGLLDLVRLRNGEVCYWPNLGYGVFGPKVTMDNAPWFDRPDQFDQRRVRLADIDGAGTTDVIYLHRDGVRLYFNQSGNGWSDAQTVSVFPRIDDIDKIETTDLLGNGTACLVWSSPLPDAARRQMRFVKLMGDQKPHLLVRMLNNLGSEIQIHYASSTRFYLQDRLDGKPWATRLPFPVQVVEKVETFDHISRNRFTTLYSYHHGYFDGYEREFRGFGMVEQLDVEAYEDYVSATQAHNAAQDTSPELQQPPVTRRTWYHTGAFSELAPFNHPFQQDYYRQTPDIAEPELPQGLSGEEWREALRALKGLPLRQEIYSFDGSPLAGNPYSVMENSFEVRMLQPRGTQRHGVFFPIGRQSLSVSYERNPAEPRLTHSLALEVDVYGHVLKSVAVAYGRKTTDPTLPVEVTQEQHKLSITFTQNSYNADIVRRSPDVYRLRVPYEQQAYEITGIVPVGELFRLDEISSRIATTAEIDYLTVADGTTPQRRLLAHSRSIFLDNALNPMPFGQWDSLGLLGQSFQLAFTPSIDAAYYSGKITAADYAAAGYVHFDNDVNWWAPSGTTLYPAQAAAHFYMVIGTRDPFGVETVATLDRYDLLVEKTAVQQAQWNVTTAVNDYRFLSPAWVTDLNGNRSAVAFDALGMVVKMAIMGKAGTSDGDTLEDPTVRIEYRIDNWLTNRKPNFTRVLAREQHGAANVNWQQSYAYSNGGGAVALVKRQARAGEAFTVGPDGARVKADAPERWIGNGRMVLNNKGRPVKSYEPYFSTTCEYEDDKALREIGVTPIFYYDAVGRNTRTEFPNGTSSRVEFTAWMQKVFDANDTVLESRWYTERGSPDPASQPEPVNDPERRAAWLAAKHANTPQTKHFDSLGRPCYAISDYGGGKISTVRTDTDLTGRYSTLFDPKLRSVASGCTALSGATLVSESAERGRRWSFQDVGGWLVRSWDEHGRTLRFEYDDLHRPVSSFVQQQGAAEVLFCYLVFGDRVPNAAQRNLLGATHQIYDQSGLLQVTQLDFKGNPTIVERALAKSYSTSVDWKTLTTQPDYASLQSAAQTLLVADERFTSSSEYDALERPTRVVLPDGSVIVPGYDAGNQIISLNVRIRGNTTSTTFLQDQEYDAKGQRQSTNLGNGLVTRYGYDPDTFRLINLLTSRGSGNTTQPQSLQDLHYTYDPVGNVTWIGDDAQQTAYFRNAVIKPQNLYEFDALYQLTRATGRELAGPGNDAIRTNTDLGALQLPADLDTNALRAYTEEYEYDLTGNLLVMRHRFAPQPGIGSGWTRHYRYGFDENPADRTNRLLSTSLPGDNEAGPYTGTYDYDAYGNMTKMPGIATANWDFMDQLQKVDLGGGGTVYYVYDINGERIRKVIERQGGARSERIYLGAIEIYRESTSDGPPALERCTLHVVDAGERIAQVDVKTRDDNNNDPANPLNVPLVRYQHANGHGSAVLETDADGNPTSYEEYHPFGTSSYRSAKPGSDLSLKRYRFVGEEFDDETGLYHIGARYYAAWLGRWTSADPAGFADGTNLFRYCRNNPVNEADPSGQAPFDPKDMTLVKKQYFTGKESLDELKAIPAVKGWKFNPDINEGNYKQYYVPGNDKGGAGGSWAVLVPDGGTNAGEGEGDPGGGDEDQAIEVEKPPDDSMDSAPAPGGGQAGAGQPDGSGDGSGDGTGTKERSFFTSSFFKGVLVGLAVTVAVVAIVATGGAALAAIAPAASAAIAASGVGTALAVGGAALTVANTVQSVRQRDLWNNPISEDEANFNLGLGVGSLAGGALARPVAGAGGALGRSLATKGAQFVAELGEGGGQLALATGGIYNDALAADAVVNGVKTSAAVKLAGTGMGGGALMRTGHQASWELRDPNGRISTRGSAKSGSDTPPGRRLSWDEQLQTHTERKILSQLGGKVKPGQTITIRGTLDPCNPGGRGCGAAMRAFAEKYGVNIVYRNTTTGQVFTYP